MKAEYSIIKAFLNYATWDKWHESLSAKDFPEDMQLLYRTLHTFHLSNEQKEDLQLQDLKVLFFINKPKDEEFWNNVFEQLSDISPNGAVIDGYIKSIVRNKLLRSLSIGAYEAAEGRKEFGDIEDILRSLQVHQQPGADEREDEFVSDNLDELLNSTYRNPGLRWRLNTLNRSLGSLRKGDFGFIFARPETGKTTFLASEVSFMAEQSEGPVLWINNEEVNDKVKSRIYQATVGATLEQMLSNTRKYDGLYNERLRDKILMPKQASYGRKDVDRLCQRYKPSLIVIDQIDKITGFAADREDLILGAIYQWARELAKQYGPVIGVCQADGSGENQRWLTMGNVANAKTSKQAEADWILGIGAISDTGWENIRFLHLSKNKLSGDKDSDPALRHGKMEVLIEPTLARYRDIK